MVDRLITAAITIVLWEYRVEIVTFAGNLIKATL